MEQLVSVIVPVYNAERYLERCVESVLEQTYENFELILVDDGSTDGSPRLCDGFRDARIRVIHQENRGVAAARNAGIEAAVGEYLAFLDADDWWNQEFLEHMVGALSENDMAICALIKSYPDHTEHREPEYDWDSAVWCWPVLNHYSISCFECIFRREIVLRESLRFTSGRITGEDQEFTYKYMMHMDSISYVSDAVYHYRIHAGSAMFQANYNHFHAVEAMKSVADYAARNCDSRRARQINDALRSHKYPQILEFAALTVLAAGDKPERVMGYLKERGYDRLLDDALAYREHFESDFMARWARSPMGCLRYYYWRRKAGRLLRGMGLRTQGKRLDEERRPLDAEWSGRE